MNRFILRSSIAALCLAWTMALQSTWGQAEAAPAPVEENPSVVALRESDPKTPEQLMFAIQVTNGFNDMGELQRYAEQLLTLNPDAATQLALHRRFGSSIFLELRDERRFGSALAGFAKAVLETAAKDARGEERIRELAASMMMDDEGTRRAAAFQLRRAGAAAPPVLLNMLATENDTTRQDRLRVALMVLEEDAIRPMIAALRSDNSAVVAQVSQALGLMKARQATPHLVKIASTDHPVSATALQAIRRIVGVAPAKEEVVAFLRKKIDGFRGGNLPASPDADGKVTMFRWDNEANTTVMIRMDVEPARYYEAAQLSTDLMSISQHPEDQLNGLVVRLQDLQLRAGLDQPINRDGPDWALATRVPPEQMEAALAEAIRRDWSPAASAALQFLGASGDVTLVESPDGKPRPIAQALTNPDRRIRYSAVRAIMELDPQQPYPGSSDLLDTLEFLVRSSGTSRVVVGHPNRGNAQTVVGLLSAQGYSGLSATRGLEVIRAAQQRPDLEFILLSSSLSGPGPAETVHLLRQDPRTADLPVGILASEDRLPYAEQLAKEDALTVAMPRLHSVGGAAVHVSRLEALQRNRTPQASRVIQAGAALRLLVQIAEDRSRYKFYEIFRCENAIIEALRLPALNASAAKALGLLGTERGQLTLVASSLDRSLSDEERDNAFAAFAAAVKHRGLMLTNAEIHRLQVGLRVASFADATSERLRDAVLEVLDKALPRKEDSKPTKEVEDAAADE